ncbi:MAG: dihydrodipicolinate synthase family protein [Chloroflexi bacterium]|nr:dihydrodipicolinate synthase family protein [Chloroflexota bacterium]
MTSQQIAGVFAAAVTPLKKNFSTDIEAVPALLDFLARRGCHGALLLGTTGEGPSIAVGERQAIWKAALEIRTDYPDFKLLAGTGTPSLDETIGLTNTAFNLGFDGVVVLPPYYFREASEDGLFTWFSEVLEHGVPEGGLLLGYHFPQISGVPLTVELIKRLKDAYPDEFGGLKDSSGSFGHAKMLQEEFRGELTVMVGNDRIFGKALGAGASGCITALANLFSPDLRRVWEAHQKGARDPKSEGLLTAARDVIERFPPTPPLIKVLLAGLHEIPRWVVRPPLTDLSPEDEKQALRDMMQISIR